MLFAARPLWASELMSHERTGQQIQAKTFSIKIQQKINEIKGHTILYRKTDISMNFQLTILIQAWFLPCTSWLGRYIRDCIPEVKNNLHYVMKGSPNITESTFTEQEKKGKELYASV